MGSMGSTLPPRHRNISPSGSLGKQQRQPLLTTCLRGNLHTCFGPLERPFGPQDTASTTTPPSQAPCPRHTAGNGGHQHRPSTYPPGRQSRQIDPVLTDICQVHTVCMRPRPRLSAKILASKVCTRPAPGLHSAHPHTLCTTQRPSPKNAQMGMVGTRSALGSTRTSQPHRLCNMMLRLR